MNESINEREREKLPFVVEIFEVVIGSIDRRVIDRSLSKMVIGEFASTSSATEVMKLFRK